MLPKSHALDTTQDRMLEAGPACAARPRTRGLVPKVMQDHFSTLQPVWVEQHLKLLCALRQVFGSDLDKPIILGVIGQRHFATVVEPYSHAEALQHGPPADMSRLTNVESIANATGIPRETVRRKVVEMVEAGWVVKGLHGRLSVTADATAALAGATDTANSMLDVTFEVLAGALVADGLLKVEVPPADQG